MHVNNLFKFLIIIKFLKIKQYRNRRKNISLYYVTFQIMILKNYVLIKNNPLLDLLVLIIYDFVM